MASAGLGAGRLGAGYCQLKWLLYAVALSAAASILNAVAGATLAMVGLFQPLRRRIQATVDRRFNRRRHDAATTIEAFTARLHDQIDLDTLSAELIAVVDQTMEPTRLSLWLRRSCRAP